MEEIKQTKKAMEKNESVDGVLNQKLLIIWLQQKPHPDFSENSQTFIQTLTLICLKTQSTGKKLA